MGDVVDEVREACAWVASRARSVRVRSEAIDAYARALSPAPAPVADTDLLPLDAPREELAAHVLQLDAINFGSGWFPTLRKREGRSGYFTVALGLREHGAWRLEELPRIAAADVAAALGQDPEHELMGLFTDSLRDLGARVAEAGGWLAVVDAAGGSAAALVERLATWDCFADVSTYDGRRVPLLKRAQIAAADLHRAGVARFPDLARLTAFADNLVPHVLRLDGVLDVDPGLVARFERGELLRHGSPEEVEHRAAAVHAVELIVAAREDGATAAEVDAWLWHRGQGARYKAVPRPRCRCTAY